MDHRQHCARIVSGDSPLNCNFLAVCIGRLFSGAALPFFIDSFCIIRYNSADTILNYPKKDGHFMKKIGVLGAGTWGMALARMLCISGHEVTVWSAIEREIDEFSSTRRHPNLPGMVIPEEIRFTKDMESVCSGKDVLLFAVPSPFVRSTARKAAPYIPDGQIIVDVAKGIEADTLLTMTQIIGSELRNPTVKLVALSGPTHAEEVAKDLPTTIVSACEDEEAAKTVQDVFWGTCMRVYTNGDVLGVELCGAMKNIIALAAGVSAGLGFGDNTKAALITRGIAEIARLGEAMGCNPQTFGGLAGIGDLIVTATSIHSRNNRCGMLLGKGIAPDEAVKQVGMVVEGINALPAAMRLSEKYGVEMPIVEAVNAIVNEGATPMDTVRMLMGRGKKPELPPAALTNSYDK
jgi:glycerol-3-phosphate dehydrogenase (NAD(P)+)